MDEILDTAPCGFVSFDDDGKILLVNKTLATMVGYEADQLQNVSIETLLSSGSRIFYQTHIFPLLKMRGQIEEIYFVLRSGSGQDVPILVNGVRHERAGTIVNDCIFVRIRHRDRYEDELLLAKKEAERATNQLAVANDRLKQLDRFKDELLSLTSHDLRALVGSIRLAGQMLLDPKRAARIDSSRYVSNIVQTTDRLLVLLEDISDLTMINTGGLRLVLEPVLLSEVVQAAVREQAANAEAKSITINVTIADDEPFIQGDRARLSQVVGNLLGNAVKFTLQDGEIAVDVRVEVDKVALSIRDSGIGIPADLLSTLFSRFTNSNRVGTAGERGSGLGLSIVHRLVNLQGGEIVVESEEGLGSTFIVRLPAVPSPQP